MSNLEERNQKLKEELERLKKEVAELTERAFDKTIGYNSDGFYEIPDDERTKNLLIARRILTSTSVALEAMNNISFTEHNTIQAGSEVTFILSSGMEKTITLVPNTVGFEEVNGFFSINSILGKALLGKKQGEIFEFKTEAGAFAGFITNVTIEKTKDSDKTKTQALPF